MKYLIYILFIAFTFNGCIGIGHQGFIDIHNDMIGAKMMNYKPYKYENAGKIIRGNFLVGGQGFTHITKNKDGNLVFHYFSSEVLPKFHYNTQPQWAKGNKKWIGKCLTYNIVNPKTGIVMGWGFDKGGNPLSCRIWP